MVLSTSSPSPSYTGGGGHNQNIKRSKPDHPQHENDYQQQQQQQLQQHQGGNDGLSSSSSSSSSSLMTWLPKFVLLSTIVVPGWYYSNGMNGVVFRQFAKPFFGSNMVVMLYVSCCTTLGQLLAGAAMAYLSLLLLQRTAVIFLACFAKNNDSKTGFPITTKTWIQILREMMDLRGGGGGQGGRATGPSRSTLVMGNLHGLGSIFTNVGFLYGKASTVQAVKLLEPFMTLGWTVLLLPGTSKAATRPAIWACIVLVVSSSIALVMEDSRERNSQTTTAPFQAICFALLSGLTLSSRNVLQRAFFVAPSAAAAATTTTSSTTSSNNDHDTKTSPSTSPKAGRRAHGNEKMDTAAKKHSTEDSSSLVLLPRTLPLVLSPGTTAESSPMLALYQQVQKSLMNFGRISLWGSLACLVGIALTGIVLVGKNDNNDRSQAESPLPLPLTIVVKDIWLYVWHPLYNLFSILTLGFCTALTHALLNSGKRVAAIAMAILTGDDDEGAAQLTTVQWAGLFISLAGGLLYSHVSKQKPRSSSLSSNSKQDEEWYILGLALAVSGALAFVCLRSTASTPTTTLEHISKTMIRGFADPSNALHKNKNTL